MKNLNKFLLAALLLPVFAAGARAEDKYDLLAREIAEAGSDLNNKKIAIIPFSYADGRTAAKDGAVVSEKITMKMIRLRKFEIIERSVLDKVMGELKLQASGAMDATSTKQLGKLLGVEAIVTGTLVEMQGGQIEVNARLIKTETAQAIGASQATVTKDWIGDAASAPQQPPAYQQPAYQQQAYEQPAAYQPPVKQAYARPRGEYEYGYFDIFLGLGSPEMSLKFYNSNGNITLNNRSTPALRASNDLGVSLTGAASDVNYNTVQWEKLQTGGFGPIALRVGGYGNNNVGGAFEFGLEKRNIKPQKTTWRLNNASPTDFTFNSEDYLTVTSIYWAGNLMVRFSKKTSVEPYMGFGLGMSLNFISLPYVRGFTNSATLSTPTDDLGIGLVLNVPFGVRFKVADKTQLVTELRWQMNTMTFDRGGISGERDTITTSGMYLNVGMGFNF